MDAVKDPFESRVVEKEEDDFTVLSRKPVTTEIAASSVMQSAVAVTARFHGFDLEDRPLISGLLELPGEVVAARTAVPLLRAQIGSTVVVLFDRGHARRPIIVGVIEERPPALSAATPAPLVSVNADDDRLVLCAEREIVLKCGDATITLTRAGKVLIKGSYILSRSSGYNKIKGAAVDIN